MTGQGSVQISMPNRWFWTHSELKLIDEYIDDRAALRPTDLRALTAKIGRTYAAVDRRIELRAKSRGIVLPPTRRTHTNSTSIRVSPELKKRLFDAATQQGLTLAEYLEELCSK